ncbi:hypothetical protein MXEN_12456 [Mycobacterium xenopi RIVM700367]|uniref:SRPBCC family protein n=1 Tax=Mycobacterium xenopi TaxID=1789 RepID=UPI00025ACCCC|nr:SRPBCC family protein [Mycobacterium xenopi]EID12561.1 hypothetical protein MXEN_12456 [Mycobacterium xenopi RIVM700367]
MSWCIRKTEHTLSQQVPAVPDHVRDFYADLQNMKLVHPLIVAVHPAARHETTAGYTQSYRITDRISLGRLVIRTRYRARICVPTHGELITEARQFPGVRLHATVAFEQIDAGTRVVERLCITAPRPLAALTVRQALDAHIAMLSAICRHFQSQP